VLNQPGGDVAALGRAVFTTYLFPFEATAGLLLIAVVGAVVLARRPRVDPSDPVDEVDEVAVPDPPVSPEPVSVEQADVAEAVSAGEDAPVDEEVPS
jgi:NADH-quinone oxidoreductase subunit J